MIASKALFYLISYRRNASVENQHHLGKSSAMRGKWDTSRILKIKCESNKREYGVRCWKMRPKSPIQFIAMAYELRYRNSSDRRNLAHWYFTLMICSTHLCVVFLLNDVMDKFHCYFHSVFCAECRVSKFELTFSV